MHTTLQEPVCPKLQRIRDVNRDAARLRLNVLPLPAGRFDLQRGDGLREEEGETAEVVVAAGVEVFVAGVFGGAARAVEHVAEVAVTVTCITMAGEQGAFGEFEDERDET